MVSLIDKLQEIINHGADERKNLPKTYKGYISSRLIEVWEEICAPERTSASPEGISAIDNLLRDYKIGVYQDLPI